MVFFDCDSVNLTRSLGRNFLLSDKEKKLSRFFEKIAK